MIMRVMDLKILNKSSHEFMVILKEKGWCAEKYLFTEECQLINVKDILDLENDNFAPLM